MSDDFYSSMYGSAGRQQKPQDKPAAATPVVPKPIPPAHQRLSGLKLTGSHMHEVEINGRVVTIPSAAYIKLLEDQIKDFRRTVTQQGDDLRRAIRAINKMNTEMEKLKTALSGTVKTRSYRGP